MWFQTTITVLALAAAVAHGAALEDGTINNREDRSFALLAPLFSFVTFDNDPCDTESEEPTQGICYSAKDCNSKDGEADGTCADGNGVCCVLSGDVTISESGSYFENLGFPKTIVTSVGAVTATLEPPKGTTQIFLEFENFELVDPIEGDCSNDTFVVVGANPGWEIPVICGNNRDQHMYIDIDNSEGPYKLIITTSDAEFDRTWKIKVTFFNTNSEDKAPPRCLQYHTETEGAFSSFNHGDESPMMLNNLNYPICFGYVSGFCDIDIKFSKFDLGDIDGNCGEFGDEAVTIGSEKICGDFGELNKQANSTVGPITLSVLTDDINENLEEGFIGSYLMMKCE